MDKTNQHSTAVVKTACAIVFLLFTFLYLYYYQADILAMTQHVLSHGKTHYNRTIGAVLITLVLYLLQVGVYALTKLEHHAHAFTYFPSLLLLTIRTSAGVHFHQHPSIGKWIWVAPLLIILWLGLVWVSRQVEDIVGKPANTGIFSRLSWVNMLTLVFMLILVCLYSNRDETFHYRMNMERRLQENDIDGALFVGMKSRATDEALTRLRAYALSRKHQLGQRLFEYALAGGSKAIVPQRNDSTSAAATIILPASELRKQYLRDKHNYELCAYLADKDIDRFASKMVEYYEVSDTAALPKHYREALTLYTRKRSRRVVTYHNPVSEADFADLQRIQGEHQTARARMNAIHDSFGNTYWYYYLHHTASEAK